jgi:hypothetical protein
MIITVVLAVLVLAAVGYVLVSRMQGQPVNTRRLLVLPAVLTAIGALQLAGALSGGFRAVDAVLLAVGLLAAAGLGAARGVTVAVFVRDGRSWLRYRPATLMLWVATVAVRVGLTLLAHATGAAVAASGPALLLTVGITLFAEGAVVARRAHPDGGRQWQARVTDMHATVR